MPRYSLPATAAALLCAAATAADAPDCDAPVCWDAPVELASGDARRGPWRMNRSRFLYVDDPAAAFAGDGSLAAVWVDNAERDVLFVRLDTAGRPMHDAGPVNVSRSPDVFSWLPRVAHGDGDLVFVLWQEIAFSGGSHGGEIHFARSGDGGRTFDAPINLSRTEAGAGKGRLARDLWHNGSLDLAVDRAGRVHAAWTEYEGALRYSRSLDDGQSFSEPLHVAGDDRRPARGPALAVGPDGTVLLAWTHGEDRAADVHVSRSDDHGGTFGAPRPAGAGSGHADAPALAFAGDGSAHLAWADGVDGPDGPYRIRHARAPAGEPDAFGQASTVVEAGSNLASVGFPALAVDGSGRLHLTWERFPERQRMPLGVGHAVYAGDSFTPPRTVPGTDDPALGFNGGLQGRLMKRLAVADDGRVAVLNAHYAEGEASRIRLHLGQPRRD